jgi:hypothetical protein
MLKGDSPVQMIEGSVLQTCWYTAWFISVCMAQQHQAAQAWRPCTGSNTPNDFITWPPFVFLVFASRRKKRARRRKRGQKRRRWRRGWQAWR